MNSIPVMLPIKEVTKRTGVSYESIRRLCVAKEIVFIRVGSKGGKYLVNYEAFLDYLGKGERRE